MKKVLLLLSIVLGITQATYAQDFDFSVDGIYYTYNSKDSQSVYVSGYNADEMPSMDVVIPASITGDGVELPVTKIGKQAFQSSKITSITIGNNVEEIDYYAFTYCYYLKSISIPPSVTKIYATFEDCNSLERVEISDLSAWCNIGLNAHSNTQSSKPYLTYIYLPAQAGHLYLNGQEITDLVIPSDVTHISLAVFSGLVNLKSVKIPSNVKYIGRLAFVSCQNLASVELGGGVNNLYEYAFAGLDNLETFYSYSTTPPICSGDVFMDSYVKFTDLYVPEGCKRAYGTADGWTDFQNIYDTLEGDVEIPAESIILSAESADIVLGETYALTATVEPSNTTYPLTWSSSDTSVASISEIGIITANAVGTATITATCGEITATCEVNVTPILAESIILEKDEVTISEHESYQIVATVIPSNTTNKILTYKSSDEEVATVTSYGLVEGIKAGEATITVTCDNISINCSVTVTPAMATKIVLNYESVEMIVGATLQLEATIIPDYTTDKTIVWTSSNPQIVTVDSNGLVEALSVGVASVTATCGDVSDSCIFSIDPNDTVGIESLLNDPNSSVSVYTVNGILIKEKCSVEDLKSLEKGIYIVISGENRFKISL